MIKSLKKYEIRLTPFNTTNEWSLNNTNNDNLILTEDDIPLALEFIDYNDGIGGPIENSNCDLALETQDSDLVKREYGSNINGLFYPDLDPVNSDGTYQRSIYRQIKTTFYNNYLNPAQIWNVENIDFELSKTKRNLSDKFLLIDIPKNIFGEKVIYESVNMYDNTLDNPYVITDDGNCNLFAGTNLFSRQQELGEYKNTFSVGTSSYCNSYWNSLFYGYLFSGSWIDTESWDDRLLWEY